MTGKTAPLESLTGKPDHCVEEAVLCQASFEDMMQAAEATLMPRLPMPDPLIDEVCSIVARVRRQGGPRRADALAKEAGMTLRSMQRLFHEYVGVSPTWLLRRYRLQEAARLLAESSPLRLAELASDLGYFDQAHLARDFGRLFGCSPKEYRSSQFD
ncbi:AraC family transcriptional regulator [Mesorhizobium loti]|nr:AraC family transcriptional regulator [Mesorhizobium loti]